MTYSKPWLSTEQQLDQLIARGLLVSDRQKALEHLQRIGYYRLSAYWYPLRERITFCPLDEHGRKPKKVRTETRVQDDFRLNARFQQVVELYVFDKQLRLLALDALERIEIALRVDISHTLGALDSFAYLKPELFHRSFSTDLDARTGLTGLHQWQSKHAQLIMRSKEDFVRHNKDRYGLPLAIWVACELWDFGTLSTLYAGMRETEQDAISRKYGIHNGRTFAKWLRSLNYLRNVCAHHSRLWNRNVIDQAPLPPATEAPWVAPFVQDNHARARCFLLLCMASHLLRVINPQSSWPERLKRHLHDFPANEVLGLDLGSMGAPQGWEALLRGQ